MGSRDVSNDCLWVRSPASQHWPRPPPNFHPKLQDHQSPQSLNPAHHNPLHTHTTLTSSNTSDALPSGPPLHHLPPPTPNPPLLHRHLLDPRRGNQPQRPCLRVNAHLRQLHGADPQPSLPRHRRKRLPRLAQIPPDRRPPARRYRHVSNAFQSRRQRSQTRDCTGWGHGGSRSTEEAGYG